MDAENLLTTTPQSLYCQWRPRAVRVTRVKLIDMRVMLVGVTRAWAVVIVCSRA